MKDNDENYSVSGDGTSLQATQHLPSPVFICTGASHN